MKFSALVLCSMLFSINSFAETTEVKCSTEMKALKASITKQTDSARKMKSFGNNVINFTEGLGQQLSSQQSAQVGGLGFFLQQNALKMNINLGEIQAEVKSAQVNVDARANELENCLINL